MEHNHFENTGKKIGAKIDQIRNNYMAKINKRDESFNQYSKNDFVQNIISFFISKIGIDLQSELIEDMKIETVLNWVNTLPLFDADQLYIIKGFLSEHNKYIFCAFFASNDKLLLDEKDFKKCFVCFHLNDEIQNAFGDKEIYLIPLS